MRSKNVLIVFFAKTINYAKIKIAVEKNTTAIVIYKFIRQRPKTPMTNPTIFLGVNFSLNTNAEPMHTNMMPVPLNKGKRMTEGTFPARPVITKRITESETALPAAQRTMFFFAVMLHNIPEGLAVGVAFGALQEDFTQEKLMCAISVAVGIGLQNFPEGAAVSVPLRRDGYSRKKSF